MATAATSTDHGTSTTPSASQAFGLVLDAAIGAVGAKLERTVAGWADKLEAIVGKDQSSDAVTGLVDHGLDAVAESGGVVQRAGAEGVRAHVHGKSPTWAAIRTTWQTGTPAVRAAIVTSAVAAVLLLLVSPALLVVYLLSWLVIEAVSRAQATRQRRSTAA